MKVFWSWQSDTPGNIGRFFIRDALNDAISELKSTPEIEEPAEKERRGELHLDHDRQGVPGSPDLVPTILRKIEQSGVFVADVTATGITISEEKKKLINSNVAIELGYAIGKIGSEKILMVMNEYFGSRQELPFDLKYKAGPIIYRLAPETNKAEIKEEAKKLKENFKIALALYLKGYSKSQAEVTNVGVPATSNIAAFFRAEEPLAALGIRNEDEMQFWFAGEYGFFLKLIPAKKLDQPVDRSLLRELVESAKLRPLWHKNNSFIQQNENGVIAFEPAYPTAPNLNAATQVFRSGEFWGFNIYLYNEADGREYIRHKLFETSYWTALHNYAWVAENILKIPPPYKIVLGATGLKGKYFWIEGDALGPVHDNEMSKELILNEASEEAINKALLEFFEDFYKLTGYTRDKNLYNFPGEKASKE